MKHIAVIHAFLRVVVRRYDASDKLLTNKLYLFLVGVANGMFHNIRIDSAKVESFFQTAKFFPQKTFL